MKFGLVGKNGAGKSAVCQYLAEKGFAVLSLSDIVRREVSDRGLESNRDNLVATANDLKQAKGAAVLAIESIAYAKENQLSNVVFDSIRNEDEIVYLKENGVIVIGVDADIELRYQRISARKGDTDHIDFQTFKAHDERENTGASSGQNINQALSMCKEIINNNGSYDGLKQNIDRLLNHYLKEQDYAALNN